MAKRAGMYSANKRKKELKRQKKQEEKLQKRLKSAQKPLEGSDEAETVDPETESPENTPQEQETD